MRFLRGVSPTRMLAWLCVYVVASWALNLVFPGWLTAALIISFAFAVGTSGGIDRQTPPDRRAQTTEDSEEWRG